MTDRQIRWTELLSGGRTLKPMTNFERYEEPIVFGANNYPLNQPRDDLGRFQVTLTVVLSTGHVIQRSSPQQNYGYPPKAAYDDAYESVTKEIGNRYGGRYDADTGKALLDDARRPLTIVSQTARYTYYVPIGTMLR